MLKIFILAIFVTISISAISNAYAVDVYSLDKVSTRGEIVGENQFSGNTIWTIIEGDKGTMVGSSDNGIVTVRFNIEQNEICVDFPSMICLEATVYETKNVINVKNGDKVEIIFVMPTKQDITILSGTLESLKLELVLDSVKYKKPEKEINKEIKNEKDPIKIAALTKFKTALSLANEPGIINELKNSLKEYSTVEGAIATIREQDSQWTSLPDNEINELMNSLINTETSQFLREIINEDLKKEQIFAISEIIVTNALGANVAQTGKTTDYDQSDEEWWQMAKINGIYVNMGYDQSIDADSANTSARIIDESGRFLGIIKIVATIV